MKAILNLETKIKALELQRENFKAELSKIAVEKKLLVKDQKEIESSITLLDYISKMKQDKIVGLIQDTITAALQDLFDESYKFKMVLKNRGNSSACDFEISCSAFPGWSEIIMSHGKSIKEVIAIVFRILLVKLDKTSRRIVILDEPSSGIEFERQKILSKFLLNIAERFGIQLIIVTHSEELAYCASKEIRING